MTKWQAFCNWWAKYWGIILGVLGAIGGVVITLLFRRNQAACERFETEATIAANARDIAQAEGRREANRERIRRVDEQIAKVDGRLADETRDLRARQEEVEGMTTQEKIDRFKKMGY